MSDTRLYLIDSSIYVYRAWHMLPNSLCDADGQPVNALLGFADFLAQVLQQTNPTHLACAFDQSVLCSQRQQIYKDYKANRTPAAPELKRQFPLCQMLVERCGISQFSRAGFEADDIIGTLAGLAQQGGHSCVILSADKDLAQFISANDQYWNFAKKERLDARLIEKRFGIRPDQIADMLALSGDKVDNIPGIPGVGQATAARLLKKWQDLDNLFANSLLVSNMKFRGAQRVSQLLPDYENTVRLSRQLTGLLPITDLPSTVSALHRQPADLPALENFFAQHNFDDVRCNNLKTALGHRPR